jgi:hypothetical protein
MWVATLVLWLAFVVDAALWMESGSFDCWPRCTTYQDVVGNLLIPLGALALLALVVAIVLSFRRRT